jgi:hypothetical protein
MLKKLARHTVVGVVLVAAGGVAMANSFGYLDARSGTGEIEYLDTRPVMIGDLGEIVVGARSERG